MNARYYNPSTGRFLTQDAMGGDAWTNNLYTYCGNNPVNFVDPTGHFPWLILGAIALVALLAGCDNTSGGNITVTSYDATPTPSPTPVPTTTPVPTPVPTTQPQEEYPPAPSTIMNGSCPFDIPAGGVNFNNMIPPIAKVKRFRDNWEAPRSTHSDGHKGVDLNVSEGTPIYSCTDGKVVAATIGNLNGNYVKIKDDMGYTFAYCHMKDKPTVKGTVRAGDIIGYVGHTGKGITVDHLHFGIIDPNGNKIKPYLSLVDAYKRAGYSVPEGERWGGYQTWYPSK